MVLGNPDSNELGLLVKKFVTHQLYSAAELQGMRSARDKGVVEELIVIPIVAIKRQRTNTAIVGRKSSTNEHAGRILPRYACERFVLRSGINSGQTLEIDRFGAAVTDSERINKGRAENMTFLQRDHVSPRVRVDLVIVHAVRLNVARVVVHVGSIQAVFI